MQHPNLCRLDSNQLTGSLNRAWVLPPSLREFNLDINQLNGTLPADWQLVSATAPLPGCRVDHLLQPASLSVAAQSQLLFSTWTGKTRQPTLSTENCPNKHTPQPLTFTILLPGHALCSPKT